MEVLLVGTVALVQFLETALVSRLRDTPGCRNIAAGGESPPPPSYPCYLYVVAKSVERSIADQLRRARSKMCFCGFDFSACVMLSTGPFRCPSGVVFTYHCSKG